LAPAKGHVHVEGENAEEDHPVAKPCSGELNAPAFDAHVLEDCSDNVREILAYLRSTAQNAGVDVCGRRYKPQTGCGITYYTRDQEDWFCQFHPKQKHGADHVGILIAGATADALKHAGFEPAEDRKDGQLWFPIETMLKAVRLVPMIVQAYDELVGA
jgi:hypothetical protein